MKPSAMTSDQRCRWLVVEAEAVGEVGRRTRCDAVEARVMPEHMTVKATRKVTKWMPNALCV